MAIAATGAMGLAMLNLAQMVSESSTFQARTGAINAAGALLSVKYPFITNVNYQKRPFAVVKPKARRGDRIATDTMRWEGSFSLIISDTCRYDDFGDAEIDFRNFIDGVWEDLLALSGTGGYVTIQTADEGEGPGLCDPRTDSNQENGKPYYMVEISLECAAFQ